MPSIFFYGPKLDKDQKREMIKDFTETTSRITGVDRSFVSILFREALPENIGRGGELLQDLFDKDQE